MTVSNMSIEAGARTGMIAPDETTFNICLPGSLFRAGGEWDKKLAEWRTLVTDFWR